MAEGTKKVLKVLCIHGYRVLESCITTMETEQSGKTFREKTGSFRKALKKLPLEFVYITAPNKIPNLEEEDQYGWWFSTEENTYDPLTKAHFCKGYDVTIKYIQDVFRDQVYNFLKEKRSTDTVVCEHFRSEKGPFDGIFSFSQGASFTSLLCALNGREGSVFNFKFAIMVAGFKSRSLQHDTFYEGPIQCPSLHVFGETDQVIPKENSVKLLQCFEDPVTLCHPGGHFVPAGAQYRKVYIEFIERFLS